MVERGYGSRLYSATVVGYGKDDVVKVVIDEDFPEDSDKTEANSTDALMTYPIAARKEGMFFLPKEGDRAVAIRAGGRWYILGFIYRKHLPKSVDDACKKEPPQQWLRTEAGFQILWDSSDGDEKIAITSPNGKNIVSVSPGKKTVKLTSKTGFLKLNAKKDIVMKAKTADFTTPQTLKVHGKNVITSSDEPPTIGSKTLVTLRSLGIATAPPLKKTLSEQKGKSRKEKQADQQAEAQKKDPSLTGVAPAEQVGGEPDMTTGSGTTRPERSVAGQVARQIAQSVATQAVVAGIGQLVAGNNRLKFTPAPGSNPRGVRVVDADGNVVSEGPLDDNGQGQVQGEVNVPATDGDVTVQVTDENGNVIGETGPTAVMDNPPDANVSPSTGLADPSQPIPSQALAEDQSLQGIDRQQLDALEAAARGDLNQAENLAQGQAAGLAAGAVPAVAVTRPDEALEQEANSRVAQSKADVGAEQRQAAQNLKDDSGLSEAERARDQARQREAQARQDIGDAQRQAEGPGGVGARADRAQADADRAASEYAEPPLDDPEQAVRESRATISSTEAQEQARIRREADSVRGDVPNVEAEADAEIRDGNRMAEDAQRQVDRPGDEYSQAKQRGQQEAESSDETGTDRLKDELDDQ